MIDDSASDDVDKGGQTPPPTPQRQYQGRVRACSTADTMLIVDLST